MQTLFRKTLSLVSLLAFGAALLCTPEPAAAQATTTKTTFSATVASTDQFVNVTSATGLTGLGSLGQTTSYLYADHELMGVLSIAGTYIGVERAVVGKQSGHTTSALVWLGPANYFRPGGSGDPYGSCVQASLTNLPRISVDTGHIMHCFSTSSTATGQWGPLDPGAGATMGGTSASVAGAQPVLGTSYTISGVNAITSFLLPVGFQPGACLTIIPSGNFTTTATNNIAKATTAVTAKALSMCYDGTNLFPSY